MKKNSSLSSENKSLKTFFLYSIAVFFIVSVALGVRLFFIFGQSKFDGHNILIAITNNKKVVSIWNMDFNKKSISILDIKKANISLDLLQDSLGLVPESQIDSQSNVQGESVDWVLTKAIIRTDGIKTNLTIIDKIRLLLFSKSISGSAIERLELNSLENRVIVDKQVISLFNDINITSDSNSIQIINATDITGLGQGLERVIVNKGGNVISVTSSRDKRQDSIIQYFGNYNYTVKKLERVLKIPAVKKVDKSIGEIAIIIGEDYRTGSMLK